jgi:hypothetical protein
MSTSTRTAIRSPIPSTSIRRPTTSTRTRTTTRSWWSSGGTITKTGTTWEAEGFLEGHLVTLRDAAGDMQYRVLSFTEDGLGMVLKGKPLATTASVQKTVFVQGAHGGLTVVHGGGNRWIETAGTFDVDGNGLTRTDGRSWIEDRYEVGQRIQIAGEAFTRVIEGFANATPPDGAFEGWGTDSILLLSGDPFAADTDVSSRASRAASPSPRSSKAARRWCCRTRRSATRDGRSAMADAHDLHLRRHPDGGKRVGGDHFVITGGAGPDSPLVVYGDTSQDGVWYSGRTVRPARPRVRRQALRSVPAPARRGERGRRVDLPAGQPVQARRQRHHRRARLFADDADEDLPAPWASPPMAAPATT